MDSNHKYEKAFQISGNRLSNYITKYKLIEENNFIDVMDKIYLNSEITDKYPVETLNSTFVTMGYGFMDLSNEIYSQRCYQSIKNIIEKEDDFNDILYYTPFNATLFALSVAWITLAFYFYSVSCISRNWKVPIILFSILLSFTSACFILNTAYIALINSSKYKIDDPCETLKDAGINRYNKVKKLVKTNEVLTLLNLIFGIIQMYSMCILKKERDYKNLDALNVDTNYTGMTDGNVPYNSAQVIQAIQAGEPTAMNTFPIVPQDSNTNTGELTNSGNLNTSGNNLSNSNVNGNQNQPVVSVGFSGNSINQQSYPISTSYTG